MLTTTSRFLAAALVAALLPTAWAQPAVKDGVLTDRTGRTLYVLDGDATFYAPGGCIGTCQKLWVPYYAEKGAKAQGGFEIAVRDDGRRQWAYKGRPLYTWWNDKQPGDHDGDDLRGLAHVARP